MGVGAVIVEVEVVAAGVDSGTLVLELGIFVAALRRLLRVLNLVEPPTIDGASAWFGDMGVCCCGTRDGGGVDVSIFPSKSGGLLVTIVAIDGVESKAGLAEISGCFEATEGVCKMVVEVDEEEEGTSFSKKSLNSLLDFF